MVIVESPSGDRLHGLAVSLALSVALFFLVLSMSPWMFSLAVLLRRLLFFGKAVVQAARASRIFVESLPLPPSFPCFMTSPVCLLFFS